MRKILFCVLYALFTVACGTRTAGAELIASVNSSVTVQSNGLFLYQYTVTNSVRSDPVLSFDLRVPVTAALQSISGPDEWVINYILGRSGITWSTYDPNNLLPILPGSSASFSFESPLAPTRLNYTVEALNNIPFPEDKEGIIIGPGAMVLLQPHSHH